MNTTQIRPLIVANWKMNTSLTEAMVLLSGVKERVADFTGVDAVICPPYPWLVPMAEELHRYRLPHLYLGAQNIFWKDSGAYTGEVSAAMLKGLVNYVIIGHSERRHNFQETDQEITAKVKMALAAGLRPILCVGEVKKPSQALLDDPSDLTSAKIRQPLTELEHVLQGLTADQRRQLIVAYEPVWAISGGKSQTLAATGHYADQVAKLLIEHAGLSLPVLYGGSVKPENAREFLSQPHLSGLLVGGASLKIESFAAICRAAV